MLFIVEPDNDKIFKNATGLPLSSNDEDSKGENYSDKLRKEYYIKATQFVKDGKEILKASSYQSRELPTVQIELPFEGENETYFFAFDSNLLSSLFEIFTLNGWRIFDKIRDVLLSRINLYPDKSNMRDYWILNYKFYYYALEIIATIIYEAMGNVERISQVELKNHLQKVNQQVNLAFNQLEFTEPKYLDKHSEISMPKLNIGYKFKDSKKANAIHGLFKEIYPIKIQLDFYYRNLKKIKGLRSSPYALKRLDSYNEERKIGLTESQLIKKIEELQPKFSAIVKEFEAPLKGNQEKSANSIPAFVNSGSTSPHIKNEAADPIRLSLSILPFFYEHISLKEMETKIGEMLNNMKNEVQHTSKKIGNVGTVRRIFYDEKEGRGNFRDGKVTGNKNLSDGGLLEQIAKFSIEEEILPLINEQFLNKISLVKDSKIERGSFEQIVLYQYLVELTNQIKQIEESGKKTNQIFEAIGAVSTILSIAMIVFPPASVIFAGVAGAADSAVLAYSINNVAKGYSELSKGLNDQLINIDLSDEYTSELAALGELIIARGDYIEASSTAILLQTLLTIGGGKIDNILKEKSRFLQIGFYSDIEYLFEEENL